MSDVFIGKIVGLILVLIIYLIFNEVKRQRIIEQAQNSINMIINGKALTSFQFEENEILFTILFFDGQNRYRIKKYNLKAERLKKQKEDEEIRKREQAKKEEMLNNSPLNNYFGAIEHSQADTIFYYLKLKNGTYKIGITTNSVKSRYSGKNGYKILYERRLVNARQVEKAIKNKFKRYVINKDKILGTEGTEIFDRDILKLDI